MRGGKLQWAGKEVRMFDKRIPKRIMEGSLAWIRPVGKPMDRRRSVKWRRQIAQYDELAGNDKAWEWLEEESSGDHGQETGRRATSRKCGNDMEIIWAKNKILICVNTQILP
jgi:hypothetical protein